MPGINVECHRQESGLALPEPETRFEVAGALGNIFGGDAVSGQPEPFADDSCNCALRHAVIADELANGNAWAAPHARLHIVRDGGLRRRQIDLTFRHGIQQWSKAVVEIVEALDEIDDAFVRLQCAAGKRLRAGLIDLDQTPVTQWAFLGHRVPCRVVKQSEGEAERCKRTRWVVQRPGAQQWDVVVKLRCRTEKQHASLKFAQAKGASQHGKRRCLEGRR
jgi:hypothetical protein